MTAKTKTGVYTLTRDEDGEVSLFPPKAHIYADRTSAGLMYWTAKSKQLRADDFFSEGMFAGLFPAIRKGTCARVRVTAEVIDD